MGSLRGWIALTAGFLALGPVTSAEAGWQSVYQVTCFHSTPATAGYLWDASYYAAPAPVTSSYYAAPVTSSYYADPCDPCPRPCLQPVVTTRYVQRCCYEPCTTYRLQTYQQAVTTYQTSYY